MPPAALTSSPTLSVYILAPSFLHLV